MAEPAVQGERGTPHPLDPLTADEIRAAVAILRRDRGVDERWRIGSVELREPAKAAVQAFSAGDPIRRAAEVVCWSRDDGLVHKARLDLTGDAVADWTPVPGAQANITVDEYHEADAVLRRDPRVVEALAQRGLDDLDKVLIDVWAYGGLAMPEAHLDRRLGWADIWFRDQDGSNPYANPVTGLKLVVDLNAMELLDIEDTGAVAPARVMGEYVPRFVPGLEERADVKPLEVVQPEGASFTLDGNALRWQKWSLRLGFNHREGLVLHTVGYEDDGRVRPVAHRLSFAEMVVPYRDPTTEHDRRTAFDIGEWGLGFMTTSLELGCDCLGEVAYRDAVLHDSRGEPYVIPNAVCIHEEDDAVLWKHVDEHAGAEVRRSRRLVVSSHVTVANYEYLIYWRLYQDGNPESEALPVGPDNPHGLALVQRETPLRTESEGRQDYDWATQRAWKVVNPDRRNALGTPVGYKLVPGACLPAMLDPASPVLRRAQAIAHTLWVTAYDEAERWPCGEFVVQSTDDLGLPTWTARDRAIEATDVVLWYVFGIHHLTRPEEWPVMAVDTVSFWLKPTGFFARNPALDVPPTPAHCHPEETP
jgi:primary-amine oxidase